MKRRIKHQGILFTAAALATFVFGANAQNITHRYSFDTDASDSVGGAHGTLEGATVSGGSLILGGGTEHASFPGGTIGINTYTGVTLELWLTSSSANTSFAMAAVLGRTYDPSLGEPDWAGYQYLVIQPTRADAPPEGRVAISRERFEVESGVNLGYQLNDDAAHHLAVTVDDTDISFYLDGAFIGSDALGLNTLDTLSNDLAYLGRSVYQFDPNWVGSIDEFRIWDAALTGDEIAYNISLGPNVVPEPTTFALGGLGLLGLLMLRRRS